VRIDPTVYVDRFKLIDSELGRKRLGEVLEVLAIPVVRPLRFVPLLDPLVQPVEEGVENGNHGHMPFGGRHKLGQGPASHEAMVPLPCLLLVGTEIDVLPVKLDVPAILIGAKEWFRTLHKEPSN
jgi:hypothetical protein